MKPSRCVIRSIIHVFVAGFLFISISLHSRNLLPYYFASKDIYRPFLEELIRSGQVKAEFDALYLRGPHWFRHNLRILSNTLDEQANSDYWTHERIDEISEYILFMGLRYGVSPSLILALMQVESSYRVDAISHKGAMGLMQLMPATAEDLSIRNGLDWYGPSTLQDPKRNIEFAIHYIRELREKFQSMELVLAAYNMGPAAVEKRLRDGMPIPDTFARKVLRNMNATQIQMKSSLFNARGKKEWL